MLKESFEDYMTVYDEYPKIGVSVAKKLHNPTNASATNKAHKLGVHYNKPLTDEEMQVVKQFGRSLGDGVSLLLPGRTACEMHSLLH